MARAGARCRPRCGRTRRRALRGGKRGGAPRQPHPRRRRPRATARLPGRRRRREAPPLAADTIPPRYRATSGGGSTRCRRRTARRAVAAGRRLARRRWTGAPTAALAAIVAGAFRRARAARPGGGRRAKRGDAERTWGGQCRDERQPPARLPATLGAGAGEARARRRLRRAASRRRALCSHPATALRSRREARVLLTRPTGRRARPRRHDGSEKKGTRTGSYTQRERNSDGYYTRALRFAAALLRASSTSSWPPASMICSGACRALEVLVALAVSAAVAAARKALLAQPRTPLVLRLRLPLELRQLRRRSGRTSGSGRTPRRRPGRTA